MQPSVVFTNNSYFLVYFFLHISCSLFGLLAGAGVCSVPVTWYSLPGISLFYGSNDVCTAAVCST